MQNYNKHWLSNTYFHDQNKAIFSINNNKKYVYFSEIWQDWTNMLHTEKIIMWTNLTNRRQLKVHHPTVYVMEN